MTFNVDEFLENSKKQMDLLELQQKRLQELQESIQQCKNRALPGSEPCPGEIKLKEWSSEI